MAHYYLSEVRGTSITFTKTQTGQPDIHVQAIPDRAFLAIASYKYALEALKAAKNEMDAINKNRGITTPAQEQINTAIQIMEGI